MSYILLTPIKDEARNLLPLKETIINQSILPLVWVIVDSGSTDNSFQISKSIFSEYSWIHVIKQNKFFEHGYSHLNFAQAINEGYAYGEKICLSNNQSFNFVGKTDATPLLSKNYFEVLLSFMLSESNLAICCGTQTICYKTKQIKIKSISNISMTGYNDIRLYNRKFFQNVGGYPLTPSPDAVILIKAINERWATKIIHEAHFIKPRLGGSKIGIWKGNVLKGKNLYVLGYNPVLFLISSMCTTLSVPPYYQLFPMFEGFIISALKKEEKINDRDILNYFGKQRIVDLIKNIAKI